MCVLGEYLAVATLHTRTQWIGCVELRDVIDLWRLLLTRPWTFHAMRTDEHPLTGQRIQPTMLMLYISQTKTSR